MHLAWELGTFLSAEARPLGDYARGRVLLERSLTLARTSRNRRAEADVLINLASNIYNNPRGDLIDNKLEAQVLLKQAQSYYTQRRAPETWAKCAPSEALCLLFLDNAQNTADAVDLLEKARKLRVPGSTDWAYTAMTLGLAYRKLPIATVGEHKHLLRRAARLLDGAATVFEFNHMTDHVLKSRIKAVETRLQIPTRA